MTYGEKLEFLRRYGLEGLAACRERGISPQQYDAEQGSIWPLNFLEDPMPAALAAADADKFARTVCHNCERIVEVPTSWRCYRVLCGRCFERGVR